MAEDDSKDLKESTTASDTPVKRTTRKTTAWFAAAIVAVFAAVFSCTEIIGDDDNSESATETPQDGSAPPSEGSVAPSVPDAVKVATPVGATVTGPNTLTVDFEGNAKALAESGVSLFETDVNLIDGTIQISMHFILDDGEPNHGAVRNDMADAVPTEDGQGTVVSGIGGRVEGTWTADNQLTLDVDGFDLSQDATAEVQVFVRETPTSETHQLILR